jgi:hypothetical protein
LASEWKLGHDMVEMKNHVRPGSREPERVIVVRTLDQLRDPGARLDPAKIASSDVMASILAALGLEGVAVQQRQPVDGGPAAESR